VQDSYVLLLAVDEQGGVLCQHCLHRNWQRRTVQVPIGGLRSEVVCCRSATLTGGNSGSVTTSYDRDQFNSFELAFSRTHGPCCRPAPGVRISTASRLFSDQDSGACIHFRATGKRRTRVEEQLQQSQNVLVDQMSHMRQCGTRARNEHQS
jgi:hypothetical protein